MNPNIILQAEGVPDTWDRDVATANALSSMQYNANVNELAIQGAKREQAMREGLAQAAQSAQMPGGPGPAGIPGAPVEDPELAAIQGQLAYAQQMGDVETAAALNKMLNDRNLMKKRNSDMEKTNQEMFQMGAEALRNAFHGVNVDDPVQRGAILEHLSQRYPSVFDEEDVTELHADPEQLKSVIASAADADAAINRGINKQRADAATTQASVAVQRLAQDYGVDFGGNPVRPGDAVAANAYKPEPIERQVPVTKEVALATAQVDAVAEAKDNLPEGASPYGGEKPDPSLPIYRGLEGRKQLNQDMAEWRAQNPAIEKEQELVAQDSFERSKAISGAVSASKRKASKTRLITSLLRDYTGGAGVQTLTKAKSFASGVFGLSFEGLGEAEAANAISNQLALELRSTSDGGGMPGAMSDKDREFLVGMMPGIAMTPGGREILTRAYEINAEKMKARYKAAQAYKARVGRIDANFEASPEAMEVAEKNWFEELYPKLEEEATGKRNFYLPGMEPKGAGLRKNTVIDIKDLPRRRPK